MALFQFSLPQPSSPALNKMPVINKNTYPENGCVVRPVYRASLLLRVTVRLGGRTVT